MKSLFQTPKWETFDLKGETFDLKGETFDLKGETFDLKNYQKIYKIKSKSKNFEIYIYNY